MWRSIAIALALTAGPALAAQTPQPFPSPKTAPPPPTRPAPKASAPPKETAPAPKSTSATEAAGEVRAPDLGVPLYPSAVYLTSYDAGRGQRFYLFGVMLSYADAVNYYRTTLKQRGEELFESPPTHQFEIGRFRESEMAFPPSVTVKDFTWGGSAGYLNPHKGGTPERFPTIVQIVPAGPAKDQQINR
jgi:hypothetical protein